MALSVPSSAIAAKFLFINKDASNIETKSRAERSSIKSHVGSVRMHRCRRRANTVLIERPVRRPRLLKWHTASIRSSSELRERAPSIEVTPDSLTFRLSHSPSCGDWQSSPDLLDSETDISEDRQLLSTSKDEYEFVKNDRFDFAMRSASPTTIEYKGNTDPFGSCAVGLQSEHIELIKVWEDHFCMCVSPRQASRKSWLVPNQDWHVEMTASIADDMRLNAIFALALTFKVMGLPMTSYRGKIFAQALEYQTKALTGIRKCAERLGNPINMISAILLVSSVSFQFDDSSVCDTHWRAMKTLVDGIGGFRNLPPTTQKLLLQSDVLKALVILRPPIFDVKDWDPGDWTSQPWSPRYHLKDTEHKYFHKTWEERIPKPIQPIPSTMMCSLIETLAAACLAKDLAVSDPDFSDRIYEWLHIRRVALNARCLQMMEQVQHISVVDSDLPLEVLTMHALEGALYCSIIFCTRLLSTLRPQMNLVAKILFRHMRMMIEGSLRLMFRRGYMSHFNHFLWMLFLGACAEELQPELELRDRWHSIHFIATARALSIHKWEDARSILRNYVYREDICDLFLINIMDEKEQLELFESEWPL